MNRTPLVYSAVELKQWDSGELAEGKYIPARPCGFSGLRYMGMRFRIAWRVFTGRYDALSWSMDTVNK